MGDEIGACFQNGSTAGKVFSGAKVVEGSDEAGQVKASIEKTLPCLVHFQGCDRGK